MKTYDAAEVRTKEIIFYVFHPNLSCQGLTSSTVPIQI